MDLEKNQTQPPRRGSLVVLSQSLPFSQPFDPLLTLDKTRKVKFLAEHVAMLLGAGLRQDPSAEV